MKKRLDINEEMSKLILNLNYKSDKSDRKPYIFDDDKKEVFIKKYIYSIGKVVHACKRANIASDTYYRALKTDREFAKRIGEADKIICDYVEALLVEYDIKDSKKFAARKFWLEAHSEKYKS